MNEVEKMYRNSGIEKCNRFLKPCPFGDECDGCEHCWYPEFTAEKQIELIKWIAHKAHNGLLINKHITDGGASMVFDNLGYESTPASSFISFEECLANLINTLWQDLTEEERKQIKTILE